jgi:hypothetical protein
MNARTVIREALRNMVCASFAYALVLQIILGAIGSGAHTSALASGLGGRSVICTSAGATQMQPEPTGADHHRSGIDCCSLGCAAPAPSVPPLAQTLSEILAPEPLIDVATGRPVDTIIRGPPIRQMPQAPRAPPILS